MKKDNTAITVPIIIFLFLWWAVDFGTASGTLLIYLVLWGLYKILNK